MMLANTLSESGGYDYLHFEEYLAILDCSQLHSCLCGIGIAGVEIECYRFNDPSAAL